MKKTVFAMIASLALAGVCQAQTSSQPGLVDFLQQKAEEAQKSAGDIYKDVKERAAKEAEKAKEYLGEEKSGELSRRLQLEKERAGRTLDFFKKEIKDFKDSLGEGKKNDQEKTFKF